MQTSPELEEASLYALKNNMALKPEEKVLIITDKNKNHLGDVFFRAAKQITQSVKLIITPVAQRNGQEPPDNVRTEMLNANVVVMLVTFSLSWTQARMDACEAGARIASMAGGFDEAILLRILGTDYFLVKERVNKLCDLLDTTNEVKIQTELGTDIKIGIEGRIAHGRKSGLYVEPGFWGNIPSGEAFIAPVEGTTNGVYVVDASQAGVGKVDQPIKITVKDGFAVEFNGGDEALKLKEKLESVGEPNAFNIAELGIGCNDKTIISGATIEDEKVLGTCHIALGSNNLFGGETKVGIHVDGVMQKPTMWFDSKKIMEKGTLLI